MELAQSGYPQPKDFKGYDEMLPVYTHALGGTAKIKELIEFLNSQEQVINSINKKVEGKSDFAI